MKVVLIFVAMMVTGCDGDVKVVVTEPSSSSSSELTLSDKFVELSCLKSTIEAESEYKDAEYFDKSAQFKFNEFNVSVNIENSNLSVQVSTESLIPIKAKDTASSVIKKIQADCV